MREFERIEFALGRSLELVFSIDDIIEAKSCEYSAGIRGKIPEHTFL